MGKANRTAEAEPSAEAAPARSKRARRAASTTETAAQPSEGPAGKTGRSTGQTAAAKRTQKGKQAVADAAAAATPSGPEVAGADAVPQQRKRKAAGKSTAAAAEAPESAPKRKAAGVRGAAAAAAAAGGTKEKPPYYLVKSEPDEFSIDALKSRPNQTEGWEGVRNFVARNHMRAMKVGDQAFFYHSSCKVPGIVGVVEVVREAYPDMTAQDSSSRYFDAKATPDNPRWFMVDFKLVRQLKRQITLEELKRHKDGALSGMALFTTARLSVQPVSTKEWEFVLSLEDKAGGSSSSGDDS